jgi:general secretion pathway protein K
MRDDAQAEMNFKEETYGYYLALAGMNKVIFEAQQAREQGASGTDNTEPDEAGMPEEDVIQEQPADGEWHEGEFGGGKFAVRMTDEGAKLALNRIGDVVLTEVLTNLLRGGNKTKGVSKRESDDIAEIVDAILDWRDADDLKRVHGAEKEYYLGLAQPYSAKDGFLDAPEELLLVRGITAELLYGGDGNPGLRDVFSVYSKSTTINTRTVTAPVLQAILGIDAIDAEEMLKLRADDGEAFQLQLQAQAANLNPELAGVFVDQEPAVVFMEARADTREERNQSRVAAVVDLTSELADGAKIVRWMDRAPWEGLLPGAGS